MNKEELIIERTHLIQVIEASTSWGAGTAARLERIEEIDWELKLLNQAEAENDNPDFKT